MSDEETKSRTSLVSRDRAGSSTYALHAFNRDLSSEFVTLSPRRKEIIDEAESLSVEQNTLGRSTYAGQDYDHRLDEGSRVKRLVIPASPSSRSRTSLNSKMEKGDLEIWWVNSPVWRRIIPVMCIILFLLTIAHACATIYYFTKAASSDEGKDFDVCKTKNCKDIANWILLGLNREADPCENFYEYACGKYSNPLEDPTDIPEGLDFSRAKFQFNQQGLLAEALKIYPDDPNQILVSFYKSCLNLRRREKNDLKGLAVIINRTNPYMFTNMKKFNEFEVAGRIIRAIGNPGLLRFELYKYPKGAVLPPEPWFLEIAKRLANPETSQKTQERIRNIYTALWTQLKTYIGDIQFDESTAAQWTITYMTDAHEAKFDGNPGKYVPPPGRARDVAISRVKNFGSYFFGAMFRTNFVEVMPVGRGLKVYPFDIYQLEHLGNTTKTLDDETRKIAVSVFWVLAILEAYSYDLSPGALKTLQMENFFPTTAEEKYIYKLQRTSLTRFCFEQTSNYLNGLIYHRFIKSFESSFGKLDDLMARMKDGFYKIRTALNFVHQTDAFLDDLSPYEAFILSRLHDPRVSIAVNYPFPTSDDKDSKSFFSELRSFHQKLRPGPDFLLNIYAAIEMTESGKLRSWESGKIHFEKRRSFHIERFEIFPDSPLFYQDNLNPPIVIFDRPLFLNDMNVFDIAGAMLYLTRNVIDIGVLNVEDPGALLAIFDDEAKTAVATSKQLINDFDGECVYNNKLISRREFLGLREARSALTFMVCFRSLLSPNSGTLVNKDGSPARVAPVFDSDGSPKFVLLYEEGNVSKSKEVNQDDYVFKQKDKYKFQYKRAPNGLENYTEKQLFFLAAIRHHCRTLEKGTNSSIEYIDNVNRVLQQVDEFSEAWDCPIGSTMNPPNKCI